MAMTTTRTGTVVGVFENNEDAQGAIRELKELGFTDAQIGVVSHTRRIDVDGDVVEGDDMTPAEEGAATGLAAGAGIGTLWGLGILAGVVPGIGPAIAGGTLGVLLSSAAAGAAAAGVAGALIGMGVPDEEAGYYENEFKSGRTIVTVKAGSRAATASSVLARFNGFEGHSGSLV